MVLNMRFGAISINRLNGEIDFKTIHSSTDTIGASGLT
jgi:hypothetical protein